MTVFDVVVAADEKGGIGKAGELPWKLPGDTKFFKELTSGTEDAAKRNAVIMGRKTWESIGRPLPGRTNIVVTRQSEYQAEGASVRDSLEEALKLAENIAAIDGAEQAFVIGGAELYRQALPLARLFHLTRIHAEASGDTRLDGFVESEWREVSRRDYQSDPDNPYDYSICLLRRE